MKFLLVALLLTLATPVAAQELEPVGPGADVASWATSLFNPTAAAIRAIRSDDPKCQLSRLMVAEGIGNVTVLVLKHFLVSPRPCIGCDNHGWPSGHSMNGLLGSGSGYNHDIGFGVSVTMAVGTAGLRVAAHRHTPQQVIAGLLIGVGVEALSYRLVQCGG
jgi:PAP2 superfamily